MRQVVPAKGRFGFTLVELLVVISIIGMLASILVPTLTSTRREAYRVSCMSNLRQLFLATEFYKMNNSGWYFPVMYVDPNNPFGPAELYWFGKVEDGNTDKTKGLLYRYFRSVDTIDLCPSFTLARYFIYDGATYGYGYNYNYIGGNIAGDWSKLNWGSSLLYGAPARDGKLAAPHLTILLADSAQIYWLDGTVRENWLLELPDQPWPYPSFHFRHNKKCNILFCDGHVESMRPYKLSVGGDGQVGEIAADNSLFDWE